MRLKIGEHDPIVIDEEALRRRGPRRAIDLRRSTVRKDAGRVSAKEFLKASGDDISIDLDESLAALIVLARRRTRR